MRSPLSYADGAWEEARIVNAIAALRVATSPGCRHGADVYTLGATPAAATTGAAPLFSRAPA